MLSTLIRSIPRHDDQPSPEDIFTSSLGLIFTDDLLNQHGNGPSTLLGYRSRKFDRELRFEVADPETEEERRKFAHYLWNSGILVGELVGGRPSDEQLVDDGGKRREWWISRDEEALWSVRGERVLELGAGVGLAGIMSVLADAEEVVISDYPATALLSTIAKNVSANIPRSNNVRVQGHEWGVLDTQFAKENASHFTRIIAADCLWMPQEHYNLARSMLHFLAPSAEARVFVVAGFHTGRAKLAAFFEEVVGQEGLEIEEIYEMNADGYRRGWMPVRGGGTEDIGERKKWLVVSRLRRRVTGKELAKTASP